jgi:hypothetical protein
MAATFLGCIPAAPPPILPLAAFHSGTGERSLRVAVNAIRSEFSINASAGEIRVSSAVVVSRSR